MQVLVNKGIVRTLTVHNLSIDPQNDLYNNELINESYSYICTLNRNII